jgi:hypothetical protein
MFTSIRDNSNAAQEKDTALVLVVLPTRKMTEVVLAKWIRERHVRPECSSVGRHNVCFCCSRFHKKQLWGDRVNSL